MKTEKNILIAFILNLIFSIFELVGGFFTGSVAILSDALHDIGDASSIGISYFLEKKSKKQPDAKYTFGYLRFSVMGSVFTTLILILGSITVITNAIIKIIHPASINYNGMIIFAVFGVIVNLFAAFATKEGDSLNQKAVNLHMLEDTLGWIVVLIGAIIMRFTDFAIIDPLMSIGVSIFIIINATKNLKEVLDLFLEKTPKGVNIEEIKEHIMEIQGVLDVHHIHIWSIDGNRNYATMHIVTSEAAHSIKEKIRHELQEHNICHVTLELEAENENCGETCCTIKNTTNLHGHHHHSH